MSFISCLFLVLAVALVNANVDLYLAESEVMKLMGISAQLFYVRNGLVNDYATKYVIPVSNSIGSLSFMWQHSVAAGRDMQYTITVLNEETDVLTTDLSISKVGNVPTDLTPFVIDLRCSGYKSAEVEVLINIQLQNGRLPSNTTELVIKRRKTCLKSTPTANYNAEKASPSTPAIEDHPNGMTVLAIGLAIAVGIVTLLFILVLCAQQKPNSHLKRSGLSDTQSGQVTDDRNGPVTTTTITSGDQTDSMDENNLYRRKIAELTLQRCRVRLSSLVQEGTFGKVYRGTYNDVEEVLVKTASEQASPLQISLLLKDGMGLYGASHPHIHSVLGVSIEDHTAPYLLYPAPMNTRNLKLFLQDNSSIRLSTIQVVAISFKLCQGLEHLHRHGLVHKDIATRNCVIDDQLNVKLSDYSLARDLFPGDYCCLGDSEFRAIRWMAIEAIQQNKFSEATDSWAFAVLVWELCTRGALPYAEVDPFEMEHYLSDGFRLTQPKNCPDELFAIIAYCWSLSPLERPTFSALEYVIRDFYTQIAKYV